MPLAARPRPGYSHCPHGPSEEGQLAQEPGRCWRAGHVQLHRAQPRVTGFPSSVISRLSHRPWGTRSPCSARCRHGASREQRPLASPGRLLITHVGAVREAAGGPFLAIALLS